MRKQKKILYINDYACDEITINSVNKLIYPKPHLWGIFELLNECDIKLFHVSTNKNIIARFFISLIAFIKYFRCDYIYSALPVYETFFFLLAKKIGLKEYRIITIIHHPSSRLLLKDAYTKCICISPVTYDYFKDKLKAEYLFWGGDNFFYNHHRSDLKKTYDFITCGKTHRDFNIFYKIIPQLTDKYKVIGDKSSVNNEITYVELVQYYSISKFVCIPLIPTTEQSILMGLTSFVDAMAMGLPVLISENSLIGIDVDSLKLGLTYIPGDQDDFKKKANILLQMSDNDYVEMCNNCLNFSKQNSYIKFASRIKELLSE